MRPDPLRWVRRTPLLAALGMCTWAAVPSPVHDHDVPDEAVPRLEDALRGHLATYAWPGASWGVLVVSLDRGDTLFAHEADAPLAPASNVKLLTTVAALQTLGPEFRYRTWLVTEAPVEAGVVRGDLVLFGTGDPGIGDRLHPGKTTVFEDLAAQLVAAGIHTVTGDLVGDESLFPGPLWPPTWDPKDHNDHFAAGVSALNFNENVVSLRVEAAERPGLAPVVHTIPDQAGLDVRNEAQTVAGRPRPRLAILRDSPRDPVRVEGQMRASSRDAWRRMTVPDPARFAVSVLRAVLDGHGVEVRGDVRVHRTRVGSAVSGQAVTAPALTEGSRTRILARHVSPPLSDYLDVVNRASNNLFAEAVFRTVGRVRVGDAAPTAAARAVGASLEELGVDTRDLLLVDGSGLSADNLARPATFVDVFRALDGSPHGDRLLRSLPEAGRRRELGRMYRTPAAGNLRAKTGTIQGVSALSGTVQSADGERLAFSMIVNRAPSPYRAKRIENAIGVELASFSRGPDAARTGRVAQLPPPPIPVDSGGPQMHRVGAGEDAAAIARRYGLTLDELLLANPTLEPHRISEGTWLVVPPRGRRPEDPR